MRRLFCFLFLFPIFQKTQAHTWLDWRAQKDTSEISEVDQQLLRGRLKTLLKKQGVRDSLNTSNIETLPLVSIAQMLKGQIAGLYVQEATGEPGAPKNMVLRGLGSPLFETKDAVNVQPTVYVNGVPIARDNNFTYSIQQYQFNRIGPATDNFAGIDLSVVESIEVIKDPIVLAKLGPLAANGAIWILTKPGKEGRREISFDAYVGLATKPTVTPVNAQYENLFRSTFYNKYGTAGDRLNYPGYLSDSTNVNYYGPANWNEEYYKVTPIYGGNLGIRGGGDRANFAFMGGYMKNASSADKTNIERYNALFNVNMAPFKWFNFGTTVNASRSLRDRNRSLRDRFGEAAYVPDLSIPISPNKEMYGQYLDIYKRALDNNSVNMLNLLVNLDLYLLPNLKFNTNLGIDYSEGSRQAFFPGSLMETNNYMSGYFGFNERLTFNNSLDYNFTLQQQHKFNFILGSNYTQDLYRYHYARAYDGPNDFIKVNVVNGDPNSGDYLKPIGGLYVNRWTNREDFRLHSFFLSGMYSWKDKLDVNAVLRYDGSSTMQPDSRWLMTPAFSAKYHLINPEEHAMMDNLNIKASWARIGKPIFTSKYAVGPNYTADLNWGSEKSLVSYNGFAVASRPYSEGWVGYDIKWPYTDHAEIILDGSMLDKRLNFAIAAYQKKDVNQLANMPIPAEYGYSGQIVNGMTVQNRGIDLDLNVNVLSNPEGLQWNTALNLNWNQNKLTALPNGKQELKINNRLLRVGEAVDKFWLYENEGIYNAETEIPVRNGQKMQFDGVDFAAGDPIWKDQNGDFKIDDKDRVLKGNAMPKLVGGFNNQFKFKGFDLNMQWYFAIGKKALNQRASTKYDFINTENTNSLDGIREVFHWQQDVDITKYPTYNPWSPIVAYRVDQDLFLENASFLKLRALSVGYDLAQLNSIKDKMKTIRRAYVYLSGTNLVTISKFSGTDPELIDFNGYYTGYGLPMSPIVTMGIKLDL
ncbi:SusC/RagA family TonB-linked outer membrane protein [Sphingobacterium sp. ML3W]|uniref:SusC/RagA family TonB-linked outer membrane protein n=1 Tax=Sphingobacterium sp. ML3W TaxID=1538644 RepID=UPI00249B530A|nr:SusC/RagA family TonB-linked outer membrane protein [Sphingobacterium sp. ML3W]WFA78093.1 SusC/RagA family TonB-linked outer membrane protein [Sphingobacterium sp. ML3W]